MRESESIIEDLEDICSDNEYILDALSELKNNIVYNDEEIKKLKIKNHRRLRLNRIFMTKNENLLTEINKLRDALDKMLKTDTYIGKLMITRKIWNKETNNNEKEIHLSQKWSIPGNVNLY